MYKKTLEAYTEAIGCFSILKEGEVIGIYTAYECKSCKKEFILLTEDIEQLPEGRYITCNYCNSQKIRKQKITDSLKECMKERSYKRTHGAIRQR